MSYAATLLVKLARANKNSYVRDFATGSAGLLVAAMISLYSVKQQKIGKIIIAEHKHTAMKTASGILANIIRKVRYR